MPRTRSRTSSEQSTPEIAVTGDTTGDKEPVATAKESLKSATPAAETKSDTTNGCPHVDSKVEDKPVDGGKKEGIISDGSEAKAPVAGETDGEAVEEGGLNKETAASQTVEKAADTGKETSEASEKATNGSAGSENGTMKEGEQPETKTTEVQEAESKAPTGDVCCAKRKTEDSEVCGEADSTCKKNKVDGEAADPVASH